MEQTPVPHVLIFPLPAQGHVNCMLKLAELLALDELHVTFLNTNYNNQRLQKYTDTKTRFARFPRFRFETIKDGIPVDSPPNLNSLIEFLSSIKTVVEPDYREMVISGRLESDGWPPVTCIIADGLLTFPIDVAKELGIQSLSFRTASACYLWACFCIPKLIEAGEVPFGGKQISLQGDYDCDNLEIFPQKRDHRSPSVPLLQSIFKAKESYQAG